MEPEVSVPTLAAQKLAAEAYSLAHAHSYGLDVLAFPRRHAPTQPFHPNLFQLLAPAQSQSVDFWKQRLGFGVAPEVTVVIGQSKLEAEV